MIIDKSFIAQWHDYKTDPPKKDGKYIICSRLVYYNDKQEVISDVIKVMDFTTNLYKIDNFDFANKKGKSGWYDYDSEWGYWERTNVEYWMEMMKTPIELGNSR